MVTASQMLNQSVSWSLCQSSDKPFIGKRNSHTAHLTISRWVSKSMKWLASWSIEKKQIKIKTFPVEKKTVNSWTSIVSKLRVSSDRLITGNYLVKNSWSYEIFFCKIYYTKSCVTASLNSNPKIGTNFIGKVSACQSRNNLSVIHWINQSSDKSISWPVS